MNGTGENRWQTAAFQMAPKFVSFDIVIALSLSHQVARWFDRIVLDVYR
jgi:hypothetical protein